MTGAPESAAEIPREDRLVLKTTTTLHALGPSVRRVGPGVGAVLKLVNRLPLHRTWWIRLLAEPTSGASFRIGSQCQLRRLTGETKALVNRDDRLTVVGKELLGECSSSCSIAMTISARLRAQEPAIGLNTRTRMG